MKEKLFNLFLFVTGNIIHEIGAVCYEQSGNDAQKLAFLQSQVATDFPATKRYPVPDRYILAGDRAAAVSGGLRYQSYLQLKAMGKQTEFFEEVFYDLGAPQNPLMWVTPIVNGQPMIQGIERWS
jgi:hypothetical protein